MNLFYAKVYNYFTDVKKLDGVAFYIKNDDVPAVACILKTYPGTSPIKIDVTDYNEHGSAWTEEEALNFVLDELNIQH